MTGEFCQFVHRMNNISPSHGQINKGANAGSIVNVVFTTKLLCSCLVYTTIVWGWNKNQREGSAVMVYDLFCSLQYQDISWQWKDSICFDLAPHCSWRVDLFWSLSTSVPAPSAPCWSITEGALWTLLSASHKYFSEAYHPGNSAQKFRCHCHQFSWRGMAHLRLVWIHVPASIPSVLNTNIFHLE